jgi:hypothetical protein
MTNESPAAAAPVNPEHPTTTPADAARPTFSDDVVARSKQFAADLLTLVPELEGIAIVHSYTIPQDRLPFGVVMGRQGPLNSPASIMHMATQMHGCLKIQLDNSFRVLRNVDGHMGEMQNQLRLLQEQIDAKQNELDRLSGGGASPAADTGSGTPSGDTG